MGQYHLVVNLDKREYLNPHQLGDGLKLMEQAMSGPGGTGSALLLLLAVSNGEEGRGGGDFHVPGFTDVIGRWGGDRIVLIGDYGEPEDVENGDLLYSACSEDDEDFQASVEWYRTSDYHKDSDKAERLEALGPITNITSRVREALAAEGWIKYSGEGWMNRTLGDEEKESNKSLRPDMVIYGGDPNAN